MNKYVKEYLHRGLIFSGLGPIVLGIIYIILHASGVTIELGAWDVFKAILSTYVMAFVHAGSSVFPTIERWSKVKAMFFQGISIYTVYLVGYLINSWIPFSLLAIGLYTACFLLAFAAIWLVVYLTAKKAANKMNEKLKEINK